VSPEPRLGRLSLVVDDGGDIDAVDGADEEDDEILESAFPKRWGPVDVVAWQETEEIGYRLFFGRLYKEWGVASWGLVTLSRGAVVAQVTYDDRPMAFTRDGLTNWLIASGVNVYEAPQLADLAVAARTDLFPQEAGDDAPPSDAVPPWTDRFRLEGDEPD
jgi:hypothetical protein